MTPVEVLVYSDASQKKGVGAWGAVVVRPGARAFEASGRLRGDVPSSTHAEIKAAANAIHAALKAGLIKPGDRVVVLCDNASAVGRINGDAIRKPNKRVELAAVADWIRGFATDRGFEIAARWIKGHRPLDGSAEVKHNRRADVLCAIAIGIKKPPTGKKARKARQRVNAAARARAIAVQLEQGVGA